MTPQRLHKLRPALAEKQIDALLVSQRQDCRYLCGFTGSSGYLLISHTDAILATDFRYRTQAADQAPDFRVLEVKGRPGEWLPSIATEQGWRRLGFDAADLSYDSYERLRRALVDEGSGVQLVATTGMVGQLRMVKDTEELRLIERAASLVSQVFEQVRTRIVPGLTEKEAAWEIEKALREQGSDAPPFDIIVASGPNSALPHATPSEKIIAPDEPVVIDMGARLEGYCSDFSRTLYTGEPDRGFLDLYHAVFEAQRTAINAIEAGMSGADADGRAREVIERAGYGDGFGHGLGHGVGLEVHEGPRLAPRSGDLLKDGMVFTIEPGIYSPGLGGCRIEDLAVLEEGRVRLLTAGDRGLKP
ncbi:MAG: M24 family metallopeptidase [Chloroflexota bacterium]